MFKLYYVNFNNGFKENVETVFFIEYTHFKPIVFIGKKPKTTLRLKSENKWQKTIPGPKMENSIGSVDSISKATDENLTTLCNRIKEGGYI